MSFKGLPTDIVLAMVAVLRGLMLFIHALNNLRRCSPMAGREASMVEVSMPTSSMTRVGLQSAYAEYNITDTTQRTC